MTKLTSCKDKYKMMNLGLFLATWTLICTCSALPDIHLQMSPEQLHTIFHVDSVENVPNYELVELTHHTPSLHHVRKRHVDSGNGVGGPNQLPHHVKKDLSKTPFYTVMKSSVGNSSDSGDRNSVSNEIPGVNNVNLSDVKEHKVSFTAFGEKVKLKLRPTEGLFKDGPQSLRMWTVHSDPNATQGLNYEEITQDEEPQEEVGHVFQDESKLAAILMRRQLETGDLIMEGSIGHELVIRPLPAEVASPLNSSSVQHVVYRRHSDPMDQLSDFAYMEPDRLQKRFRRGDYLNFTRSGRTKRAVPHVIYPEILVIVDHDGYRLHGGDNIQVKRYFVSFWNGVDLRYRLLKGPRIRISIAGIIISRGRDATPYLERNRVGRDAIDSAAALTDMGKYLFRERRLPVYDIAVAITKLDMCRRQYANDVCNRGTAGFAYVGGACVVNKRLEKVNSVAIIEDTGGFSGIIVAAHEVGHLLGAVHDGSPPPSYLGGPGAEKCRWEDGYIMSDLRHTERGFRWSPCSIQSFHHFLNGDTASCLHNAPHEDEALGRALPGTLLSLDAQCRRDRGTSACFKDERVCAQLFCFDAASGYCVAYRPAAEGSSCGDGLHCLDGRCVQENENIIPDYSQHTPSYASPNAYNSQISTESYSWDDHSPSQPTTRPPPPPPTFTTIPTPSTTTPPPFQAFFHTTPSTTTRAPFTFKFKSFFDTPAPYPPYQWQKDTTVAPTYAPFPTTTTTTTPPPPPSTTSMYWPFSTKINPFYYGLHNYHNSVSSTQRSTTRNALFDLYLSRIATTTKSPYNFENFGQYSKSTTKNPPSYLNNFLGSNTNTMRVSLSQVTQAA